MHGKKILLQCWEFMADATGEIGDRMLCGGFLESTFFYINTTICFHNTTSDTKCMGVFFHPNQFSRYQLGIL